MFVGYDNSIKGYKLWNPLSHSTVISTNVVFEESIFPLKTLKQPCQPEFIPKCPSAPAPPLIDLVLPDSDDKDNTAHAPNPPPDPLPGPLLALLQEPCYSRHIISRRLIPASMNASPDKVQRWIPAITVFNNSISAYLATVHITPTGDPNMYKYALSTPEAPYWQSATEVEIQCLADNGTWVLVDLPKDHKTIKCKWVHITKCNMQGNMMHHRAHLVAKGFSQTEGINYKETFAPVA